MTITAPARPTGLPSRTLAMTELLPESPSDEIAAARILNDAQCEFDRSLRCGYSHRAAEVAAATVLDRALMEAWAKGRITGRRAIATARDFGRQVAGLT